MRSPETGGQRDKKTGVNGVSLPVSPSPRPPVSHRVTFLPDAATAWVASGSTLLVAAAAAHVAIDAPCGDRGICGKCKVRVVSLGGENALPMDQPSSRSTPLPEGEGELPRPPVPPSPRPPISYSALEPPTLPERTLIPPEDLAAGWRLACQARVTGDVTVAVPERALKAAIVPLSQVELRPNVRKFHLILPEATIMDPLADLTRVRRSLAPQVPELHLSLSQLRALPAALKASPDVTAVVAGNELLALEKGDTTASCYGVAVDLGTTSVVAILADLVTGQVLGVESRLNGQANFGADVISRIHKTSEPDGLEQLQSAAAATINSAIQELAGRHQVSLDQIYEVVVVGNCCMNHLFLGIDPQSLALAPYQPVTVDPVVCKASELGLVISPHGQVYTLPNVAGFVGSDTIAVILATAIHRSEDVLLALDLGTNGEMVLGNKDRLLACSTAAGPAFEGARISCGMRATDGAIERVWIDEGKVKLQVIGQGAPLGLCGSGLLDAVAQMRRAGFLEESGRLVDPNVDGSSAPSELSARIVSDNGAKGFMLGRRGRRPVVLTQRDVRELQLAKGAIRAGISILMKELDIEQEDITEILLAGAFGSYINPASSSAIGLVPPLPLDRITAVGNAAGQGAVMALLSTRMREDAVEIARSVEYVELAARPDFMDQFMDAMFLS